MIPTKFHFNILFSKPCQRQYELLPSLDVRRLCHPFTFHILIFSENPQPNELKLVGSIYGRSSLESAHFVMIHYQTTETTDIKRWQKLILSLARFAKKNIKM
jgi:hypothetical protein